MSRAQRGTVAGQSPIRSPDSQRPVCLSVCLLLYFMPLDNSSLTVVVVVQLVVVLQCRRRRRR